MTDAQRAMTLRLPAEQAEALEFLAEVDGVSVSQAIRDAVESHIEARRADHDFQERLAASVERHKRILDRLAGHQA
ncbi:ribbon-helix-helix protein, CopG family [Candidatus Poriferisocius sp.]|uniref:ribbon-helix-helix protein, CopG family n=1 Tax=Candidatus Poriferisocius sp. TaxID=3101276 RepID=UPI003B5B3C99